MTALSLEDRDSLSDALRKALHHHHDFATWRVRELAAGFDRLPPIWSRLVELGLSSLMVPESDGGFGGCVEDLQRVQRELGRWLVVAPWFETALCTHAIVLAGTPAQRAALLPGIADGAVPMTLADGHDAGLAGTRSPAVARVTAIGWQLDGWRMSVRHAGCVGRYLVPAELATGESAWFVVDPGQTGVRCSAHRLVDGTWAADVRFEAAAGEMLGSDSPHPNHAAVQPALRALCAAGQCAEALGMAEAALEATVRYLRTRKQFGQPLGEFQALRHRVAEMYIALEQARSAAEMALSATGAADPVLQSYQAAQAQLVSSEAVAWILQQAIQLHGGMGMTDDLVVGHYYRRMLVMNAQSGGSHGVLARLGLQEQ